MVILRAVWVQGNFDHRRCKAIKTCITYVETITRSKAVSFEFWSNKQTLPFAHASHGDSFAQADAAHIQEKNWPLRKFTGSSEIEISGVNVRVLHANGRIRAIVTAPQEPIWITGLLIFMRRFHRKPVRRPHYRETTYQLKIGL